MAIVAALAGDYADTATWVGGVVPGPTDDINLAGYALIISTAVARSTGLNTDTVTGGKITVVTGGSLDVGTSAYMFDVVLSGGSILDSTATNLPLTCYSFNQSGGAVDASTSVVTTNGNSEISGGTTSAIASGITFTLTLSGGAVTTCSGDIIVITGGIHGAVTAATTSLTLTAGSLVNASCYFFLQQGGTLSGTVTTSGSGASIYGGTCFTIVGGTDPIDLAGGAVSACTGGTINCTVGTHGSVNAQNFSISAGSCSSVTAAISCVITGGTVSLLYADGIAVTVSGGTVTSCSYNASPPTNFDISGTGYVGNIDTANNISLADTASLDTATCGYLVMTAGTIGTSINVNVQADVSGGTIAILAGGNTAAITVTGGTVSNITQLATAVGSIAVTGGTVTTIADTLALTVSAGTVGSCNNPGTLTLSGTGDVDLSGVAANIQLAMSGGTLKGQAYWSTSGTISGGLVTGQIAGGVVGGPDILTITGGEIENLLVRYVTPGGTIRKFTMDAGGLLYGGSGIWNDTTTALAPTAAQVENGKVAFANGAQINGIGEIGGVTQKRVLVCAPRQ